MRIPMLAIPVLFFIAAYLVAATAVRSAYPGEDPPWFAIAAVTIALGSALTLWMKNSLLRVHVSSDRLVPTSPEQHPGIDVAMLETLTAQLAALGFEQQVDYTLVRTPPNNIQGFARLFYSSATRAYAEVNQVLLSGRPATPMALTLFNLYENDWSFSTLTRPPTRNIAVIYALRRPRRLWQILPGTSPQVAVEKHVAKAQVLSVRLQLKPVEGDPIEAYLTAQERQKRERYEAHRKRNLFAFLWDIDRYMMAPKLEWLGNQR